MKRKKRTSSLMTSTALCVTRPSRAPSPWPTMRGQLCCITLAVPHRLTVCMVVAIPSVGKASVHADGIGLMSRMAYGLVPTCYRMQLSRTVLS